MTIMTSDLGAQKILDAYFKRTSPAGGNDLTLKLYANNITPMEDDIAANFAEVSGGGYAAKTLAPAAFSTAVVDGIAVATAAEQDFTFSGVLTPTTGPPDGTATIYGYYVVDADGVFIFGDALVVPFTPTVAGQILGIIPAYQLSKGTPT